MNNNLLDRYKNLLKVKWGLPSQFDLYDERELEQLEVKLKAQLKITNKK